MGPVPSNAMIIATYSLKLFSLNWVRYFYRYYLAFSLCYFIQSYSWSVSVSQITAVSMYQNYTGAVYPFIVSFATPHAKQLFPSTHRVIQHSYIKSLFESVLYWWGFNKNYKMDFISIRCKSCMFHWTLKRSDFSNKYFYLRS